MRKYKSLSVILLSVAATFALVHLLTLTLLTNTVGVKLSTFFINLPAYGLPIAACVLVLVANKKEKPNVRISAFVMFGLLMLTYFAMAMYVTVGLILNEFMRYYGEAVYFAIGIVPLFEFWAILSLRPTSDAVPKEKRRGHRIAGIVLLCVTLALLVGMLTHGIIAGVFGALAVGTSFPWWVPALVACSYYVIPLLAVAGATVAIWQCKERKNKERKPVASNIDDREVQAR